MYFLYFPICFKFKQNTFSSIFYIHIFENESTLRANILGLNNVIKSLPATSTLFTQYARQIAIKKRCQNAPKSLFPSPSSFLISNSPTKTKKAPHLSNSAPNPSIQCAGGVERQCQFVAPFRPTNTTSIWAEGQSAASALLIPPDEHILVGPIIPTNCQHLPSLLC